MTFVLWVSCETGISRDAAVEFKAAFAELACLAPAWQLSDHPARTLDRACPAAS